MSDSSSQRSEKSEFLATDVVQKVADRRGVDPLELSPPLQTVIDTDSIESLFSDKHDGFVRVEFTYLGYTVTIEGEAEPRVTVE
ncbi:HalOD1 output domain-containing protein [Natronomonas sp.]|uniref:HalOD1 output domain-containing protein n=1 Tax=Natronomonas sp. TaxID=2184060 RepID=UPI0039751ED5